jgi:hypothetical protein
MKPMNVRFVLRGSLLAVTALLLATAAVLLFTDPGRRLIFPPIVPLPPVINAPRGALPPLPGGLVELTKYGSEDYHPVGRGFLLRLPNDEVIGVTTAHSLSFQPPPLQSIALAMGEQTQPVFEFDAFHGEPGQARTGEDMSIDFTLLHVPTDIPFDPALLLYPDPRGLPQAGERVALVTLVNDQPRRFDGAVLSSYSTAIWVVMDEEFEPSGLSGSPFVSQHTGQVIGMAIATMRNGDKVLLGLHPIGSLVEKAEAAQVFPKMADYRR